MRPEVLELLAARAHAWRSIDPSRGLAISIAATDLAQDVPSSPPLAVLLEDAKADAWAVRANLERMLEKYYDAGLSWARARTHRACGSGDPLLEARHSDSEAALHRAQRNFPSARALSSKALSIYRQLGERQREAATLVTIATIRHAEGRDELALRSALAASLQLDVSQDPTLAARLLYNSIAYGIELGHRRLAHFLFDQSAWFLREYLPPTEHLLAVWMRGRLARELGELRTALRSLEEVRKTFIARDKVYDASLASLELATIYLEANLPQRARELAEEMLPVFVSKQIPREASAALLVYVHAARQEGLSAALLEHVMFDFKRIYQRDANASSLPK